MNKQRDSPIQNYEGVRQTAEGSISKEMTLLSNQQIIIMIES